MIDLRRTNERVYNVKTLNERRHMILRLHCKGFSNIQIAQKLQEKGVKCTAQNVSDIINSPIGQQHLINLRGKIEESLIEEQKSIVDELAEAAPAAMRNLKQAVVEGRLKNQTVDTKQRLELSKYLLSCAGHGPIQRTSGKIEHEHALNREALDFIKAESARYKQKEIVLEAELVEESA